MHLRSPVLVAALVAALPLGACTDASTKPAATTATTAATAEPAPAPDPLVARGEYIARIAGCNDCHTPGWDERKGEVPVSEWLVGVPMGFTGPWGTTFASNLRLRAAEMDEAAWLDFTATLTTRPIMPYYNVRAMAEEDRRALHRFLRALGPAGEKAPAYLPPGELPPGPRFELVLPGPKADAGSPAG